MAAKSEEDKRYEKEKRLKHGQDKPSGGDFSLPPVIGSVKQANGDYFSKCMEALPSVFSFSIKKSSITADLDAWKEVRLTYGRNWLNSHNIEVSEERFAPFLRNGLILQKAFESGEFHKLLDEQLESAFSFVQITISALKHVNHKNADTILGVGKKELDLISSAANAKAYEESVVKSRGLPEIFFNLVMHAFEFWNHTYFSVIKKDFQRLENLCPLSPGETVDQAKQASLRLVFAFLAKHAYYGQGFHWAAFVAHAHYETEEEAFAMMENWIMHPKFGLVDMWGEAVQLPLAKDPVLKPITELKLEELDCRMSTEAPNSVVFQQAFSDIVMSTYKPFVDVKGKKLLFEAEDLPLHALKIGCNLMEPFRMISKGGTSVEHLVLGWLSVFVTMDFFTSDGWGATLRRLFATADIVEEQCSSIKGLLTDKADLIDILLDPVYVGSLGHKNMLGKIVACMAKMDLSARFSSYLRSPPVSTSGICARALHALDSPYAHSPGPWRHARPPTLEQFLFSTLGCSWERKKRLATLCNAIRCAARHTGQPVPCGSAVLNPDTPPSGCVLTHDMLAAVQLPIGVCNTLRRALDSNMTIRLDAY